MNPRAASGLRIVRSCEACGNRNFAVLPRIEGRAVMSDGRAVSADLSKESCLSCGLARATENPRDAARVLFESDYTLYAHAPGGEFERVRQRAYAAWIETEFGTSMPARVFEIGCGNGSLMLELADRWRASTFWGIEASAAAVAHARAAGFDVARGYVDGSFVPCNRYDLVLAVNVIEHTPDPVALLAAAATLVEEHGTVVLICPDGEQPWSELVIHDHLFSFTRRSLRELAMQVGLTIVSTSCAPAELGLFHMSVMSRQGAAACDASSDPAQLHMKRETTMAAWAALDRVLAARCAPFGTVTCFGVGETAGQLRAYAPSAWRKVTGCTADRIVPGKFGPVPLLPYDDSLETEAILLAVRPAAQARLEERLAHDGHHVIRWDDLVSV